MPNADVYGSRKVFIMLLLYTTMGISSSMMIPQVALETGAMGSLFIYFICYTFVALPIMYLELTVSQFTGRNCIEIWQIRPCLSHLGYIVMLWQFITLLYNHIFSCALIHYFFLSFERPQKFYTCGHWAEEHCDELKNNYTLNQICCRVKNIPPACDKLYETFPEYQFYKKKLLGGNRRSGIFISWPLVVASTAAVVLLFVNCFRRIKSMKWFIYVLTAYPVLANLVLMMVSMSQRGLIGHFGEAFDVTLDVFSQRMRVSRLLQHALMSAGCGQGVLVNLAALASFRQPSYADAAVALLAAAGLTVLNTCNLAMMACPNAFTFGVTPFFLIHAPISNTFVKIPRMFGQFSSPYWLVLIYSSLYTVTLSTNSVLLFGLLETLVRRNPVLEKYTIILTLSIVMFIFFITVPLHGTVGKRFVTLSFIKYIYLASTFFSICEILVFVVWYGFERFYEDIHFMQGIQPKKYIKICWMVLPFVLIYSFGAELYYNVTHGSDVGDTVGRYFLVAFVGVPVLIALLKLLIALFRKTFWDQFKLDPAWGPQNELLMRSRNMFTAHAMTKEYMYRQYHVQAGIFARQQSANVRTQNIDIL